MRLDKKMWIKKNYIKTVNWDNSIVCGDALTLIELWFHFDFILSFNNRNYLKWFKKDLNNLFWLKSYI